MNKIEQQHPDYIFETSWEVCNKVGGIYTVLSTKALQEEQHYPKHVFYLGPYNRDASNVSDFKPLSSGVLYKWARQVNQQGSLHVRVGHWNVPGSPYAILVDYTSLIEQRNTIYGNMWEWFGVDSLHAYGDYHESSMFGYACGQVIEHFYHYFKLEDKRVVAHFHEWMSAFGLFYCRHFLPQVATLFTTHATGIGRSIAANGKPLYDQLAHYNGDQMARELNMEAKHSAEKQAAHHAHCFTTVSHITASECAQLLEREVDIVTPNGFEDDFVATGALKTQKRKAARKVLLQVAERVSQSELPDDTLFVAISGRYEYKNKGIDLFIDTMHRLQQTGLKQSVVAYVLVPAWISAPRTDLFRSEPTPSENRFTTHQLMEPYADQVMQQIERLHITNQSSDQMKLIFVPSYLSGNDGVFNMNYYDLLVGFDLTLFPSYYEPWGYTPMESAAFGIPTITTDLAGFGRWSAETPQSLDKGIAVLHRTDANREALVDALLHQVQQFLLATPAQRIQMGRKASNKTKQALWTNFFTNYERAYDIALTRVENKH